MKKWSLILGIFISIQSMSQSPINSDDFKTVVGEWNGNLTYLDYSTNTHTSIPVNLKIRQFTEAKNKFEFIYAYPNEPSENSSEIISIKKNGKFFGNERLVSRKINEDGSIEIVTSKKGKDNGKKALINYVYILSPTSFIVRKEVKSEDADGFFMRNEYAFTRM